jgi:two-component system chemotaxis response regulator CheB
MALRDILSRLPVDFPVPVLIAQHGPERDSHLAQVLQFSSKMSVCEAAEGDRPRAARVYVPPAGAHLEVMPGGEISVARRGRIASVHPSADLLFTSAAACYGERTCAIVLTGRGRDGAEGVKAVRGAGGFVIAQDRVGCECFDMPEAAIETRKVDLVLALGQIPVAMLQLQGIVDVPLRKPARRPFRLAG